jgi:integrase
MREYVARVGAHLPTDLRPVIETAFITGWRVRSEIVTRQWSHVDFAGGWLILEPGEAKNRETRRFPFIPSLRRILERQRERKEAVEQARGQAHR